MPSSKDKIEFKIKEDIMEPLRKTLYPEEDDFKKIKNRMNVKIGLILSKNPIFKKRINRGKVIYSVKKEQLIELLEAKRFLNIIKEQEETETTEEEIKEETIDTEQDKLLRAINELDTGEGADIEEVRKKINTLNFDALLEKAQQRGDIFYPKPGKIKTL
jgi:hypothetical protein